MAGHGHSLLCMVYVLYIIDRARPLKLFHFVAPALKAFWGTQGNANANANERIKKTGFIGSMPPRRSEVESEMASSILYEKLAESVRKYPVLYDKRCADKLKKTLT